MAAKRSFTRPRLPVRIARNSAVAGVLFAVGAAGLFGLPGLSFRSEKVATLELELLAQARAEQANWLVEDVRFTLPALTLPVQAPAQVAPPPEAADVLAAIAQVESQGNPRRVGRLGERGLYQFRRGTWRQHTRHSFNLAHHPEISTAVARRHYEWIVRQLRLHGFEANPYEVALAWNAGLDNVLKGRSPRQAHDYAQRVANLVSVS